MRPLDQGLDLVQVRGHADPIAAVGVLARLYDPHILRHSELALYFLDLFVVGNGAVVGLGVLVLLLRLLVRVVLSAAVPLPHLGQHQALFPQPLLLQLLQLPLPQT